MRILILSQWFDPEPTFKGLQFARELKSLGHDVEVLTGFPNYPGGQVYAGYRIRPFQREELEGISVLRVPLYSSHSTSGIRRALNYGTFALSASIAILTLPRADVVYSYHPPATAALPALIAHAVRGVPYVFDVQDLWPDSLKASGMRLGRFLLSAIGLALKRIYQNAAHIVVLSPGFRTRLIERGVPPGRITVIPNWTYEHHHHPRTVAAIRPEGDFNVVYAGNMGLGQALDTILDAAVVLQSKATDVRIILIGDGIDLPRLKSRLSALKASNVVFLPRKSTLEIDSILSAADVLLVHLKNEALYEITIPSKTQAYLRAGKPILMGVRGDAADLVQQAGAGLAFTPEDPNSLAGAVLELKAQGRAKLAKMGKAGADYYARFLSQSVGVKRFVLIFEEACFANPPAAGLKRLLDLLVAFSAFFVVGTVVLALAVLVAIRKVVPLWSARVGSSASTRKSTSSSSAP